MRLFHSRWVVFSAMLVMILAGGAMGGQRVIEDWVATYDSNSDYATAIALDDSGNIYITGLSSGPSGRGCATIKYNSDGNEQWVAWYDGVGGEKVAIGVDDLENVYIACVNISSVTFADYAIVKYDPNGSEVWVATYNGTGNSADEPAALAIDDLGNVYVTGGSSGSGTSLDYATVKYAPDSNQPVWVARYNGSGNDWDVASAITIDNSGNVYVTGTSMGSGTGLDYATIKYAPDSNMPVWVARYNGTGNYSDRAYAIAVDDSCNVYVTGSSRVSADYSTDCLTIKYGSDSNEPVWIARYDSPTNYFDFALDITIDDLGNVFVTGDTVSGVGADYDYITIKYGPDSNEAMWVEVYDSNGNNDYVVAIAVDGSCNVYVTGSSEGDGTNSDYATIKYDTNGTELWEARYNGPGNGYDDPVGINVDDSGNVYIAGSSIDGTGEEDYATVKYV